ncbi:MAG TPA: translation initiation factor IF-3 [Verrucomicrobia bacterium]|nr:translation initiation factor IF-3 [Verrucomicrobiota bacterium]
MRVNHKIRVPEVRLTGADGALIGVVQTRDALRMAQEQSLDLVEISPNAKPPVCKIMDYGKYRYNQGRKEREQRKHQHQTVVKEIKFRPGVEEHDYETKVGHVREFLQKGNKVKLTLTFRGRENAHRELGEAVLERVMKECADISVIDMAPKRLGRMVTAMLGIRSGKGEKNTAKAEKVLDE